MTSERQLGLFPEGGDECGAPLHGLEPVAGELADLPDGVQAQVGDLVFLQIGPDRLDRIEFRRVGRQAGDSDVAVQFLQPCLDQTRAVRGNAVPDDQQRPLDLALERTEEFDDLLGADGTGEESEIELPEGQPGDGRELFPGEAVLQDRRVAAQAPGARDTGTFGEARFVYEDDGATLPLGFF